MITNGAASVEPLTTIYTETKEWLCKSALPLWSSYGYDPLRSMFEEQLYFSGIPVVIAPQRLMVQARQISVYTAAALSGLYPEGAEKALRACQAMIKIYLEADDARGWIFSTDRFGRPVETKRDLYAHAFVLFALAWVLRLDPDPLYKRALSATLGVLDEQFSDTVHSGYWDSLPRTDTLRRQNSHMHLFEAFITLYETTKQDEFLERTRRLYELTRKHFIDPATGVLRESFDDCWNVHPEQGKGSVEPGHMFEWAWLLRRYQAATGKSQDAVVASLIRIATSWGMDCTRGRIVAEISESGEIRSSSSRCWPHAEALKALSEDYNLGHTEYTRLLDPILRRLRVTHCKDSLNGGWVDHVDANDEAISTAMPASSLYHLFFGITAVECMSKDVAATRAARR